MDASKKCFKCGENKPIGEFYKHPRMADGHLNKCKDCTKLDAMRHRSENAEKIQAYDRRRHGTDECRAKKNNHLQKLMATAEGRKLIATYKSRWDANNLEKKRAHLAVSRAIKKGVLIRQPCERCGNIISEGHHEDYSKPLDVIWLCRLCHGNRHAEINEQKRQAEAG